MRSKLFGYTILVVVVITLLQGILSYETYKNIYIEENKKWLVAKINEVEKYIYSFGVDKLNNIYNKGDFRVTIVGSSGVVLYDSEANVKKMENHLKRPEIANANRVFGKVEFSMRRSKTLGHYFLYAAKKVKIYNTLMFIRVSVPLDKVDTILKKVLLNTLKFAVMCIFLGIALAIGISSVLYQPLKGLISLISEGLEKFSIQDVKSPKDLKWLSLSFSKMYQLLEEKIGESNILRKRLTSLLDSLDIGIIFFDMNKRILTFNRGAENILETNLKVGFSLLECVRVYELFEFLFQQDINEKEIEISINNKTKFLKINKKKISYEDNKEGILLILSDITFLKKLERIRSDFVANVSHELKTPLTSIKGFVETLKDGAIDDKDVAIKFLNIIEVEVERLVRLINDLLYLSEIENAAMPILEEKVVVKEVVLEIIELLKIKAEKKNIQLDIKVQEGLEMNIYRDWLKQIFINLIDNAIVYNKENGKVWVTVEKLDNLIVIKVKDTGIGIPEKEIERIFERFYRVDKGRSRKFGGTGLGLSIVKHIVELYGGKVWVESQEGIGSEFTVTIPIVKKADPHQ
ncbi:two-component system phosphate regulon sensor histidine kinase PhoR [Caldicellulosiruptor bescii]|uniref:histidine kinase n=2 Tax=Caldicellulosiruptor bescii TaxID=31899 RepID=B9MJS6_CALBD|nr:ATP-binding protein [Caldicellulosiruptor bescii]ACM60584.1 histidine kinase [Caldicellulosiruptor bescii DSM 6725]PBC87995.1 two-component system phosphate regulon sensor histidine kinase PhoR [Caldicellulosiruptor bescii]PBC90927.1 two-component system phosphate regulon sensor histidine kinase PhoR [Caldicellulosiruptor bescii]PBD03641.1 two-component system phosphate regulon sensor histidine kinase PhoR [Caldicellulosiruptor bescii]PBD06725.1 two-component system phosphate regulon sensor